MLTKDGSTPSAGDVLSPNVGARDLECGEPPQGARCSTTRRCRPSESGPWVQVSRLGNPLFNEVIVPLGQKDDWNREQPGRRRGVPAERPASRARRAPARPLPRACSRTSPYSRRSRADLVAILLTGIPNGVIPGVQFQNYTGPTYADMLRLNVAIPATRVPERPRHPRRRPRRLPERPPGRGRHRRDRAAGDRRRDLSARRTTRSRRTERPRCSPRASRPTRAATCPRSRTWERPTTGTTPPPSDEPTKRCRRRDVPPPAGKDDRCSQPCATTITTTTRTTITTLHEVRAQPVVLDLGDGVGALIVHTDPELLGVEIEISPAGDDGRPPAQGGAAARDRARRRRLSSSTTTSPEGDYTLWLDDEPGPAAST